ncbi:MULTISPECIES: hypothetical protein [Petrotoga]|uniref:hypothetical protein n=1 Tax=Petrotoga TaxID=28236 RepID=UPI0011AF1BFA|nr:MULTISPECIES: hypothetical protein [Petrotoga]
MKIVSALPFIEVNLFSAGGNLSTTHRLKTGTCDEQALVDYPQPGSNRLTPLKGDYRATLYRS